MIFEYKEKDKILDSLKKYTLADFNLKELDLQKLLFNNLEKLFPEDELLLIMESKAFQEEPDLMAIDRNGDLYIFELKAWESEQSNLLQVLRYGQKFGQMNYQDLNTIYNRRIESENSLIDVLNQRLNSNLIVNDINKKQHFVLITNGLDSKTRNTVQYWKNIGLDIQTWIYRLYKVEEMTLIEFNTFRRNDDPYEDLEGDYWILNTNKTYNEGSEDDMLENSKASAYGNPDKKKIEKIAKGDKVFLYSNKKGIIAVGIGSGYLQKKDVGKKKDHEYFMNLENFKKLKKFVSASKIKEISDQNYSFNKTIFRTGEDNGKKIWDYINKECI